MSLVELLRSRELIDALTDEKIDDYLSSKPRMVYLGIDPTASAIHLGNFVGLKILKHFQDFGHRPVILLGGATALIGDPSGKSKERPLLSVNEIEKNICTIRDNVQKILPSDNEKTAPLFVNNYDWTHSMDMITFLRDIGKYFRLSTMLSKESVKARLNSDEGISYIEMSYQILQAFDFYHLNQEYGVSLQVGGSDQYGNITAGIEYARKKASKKLFGLTNPLLTRADGKKFGKSEEGTIWLDETLCSHYDFYQHLLKVTDEDVVKFLKMLTFVSLDSILDLEKKVKQGFEPANSLQKLLARELTLLVHGNAGLERALEASKVAAPGSNTFDEENLWQIKDDIASIVLSINDVLGRNFLDLVHETKLLSSKGEIRRMINNKGVYLNGRNIADPQYILKKDDILKKGLMLISIGKKKVKLIEIKDD